MQLHDRQERSARVLDGGTLVNQAPRDDAVERRLDGGKADLLGQLVDLRVGHLDLGSRRFQVGRRGLGLRLARGNRLAPHLARRLCRVQLSFRLLGQLPVLRADLHQPGDALVAQLVELLLGDELLLLVPGLLDLLLGHRHGPVRLLDLLAGECQHRFLVPLVCHQVGDVERQQYLALFDPFADVNVLVDLHDPRYPRR